MKLNVIGWAMWWVCVSIVLGLFGVGVFVAPLSAFLVIMIIIGFGVFVFYLTFVRERKTQRKSMSM